MLGQTVRFYGRGYGHGVGMSQHGARGRALAGQTSTAILAHYYRGAVLGTIPTTSQIRVRVLYAWQARPTVPLLVYGRRTAWSIDGIAKVFPVDAALRLIPRTTATATGPRTTWRLRVTAADGTVLHDAAKPASVALRGAASGTRFQLWSKPGSYDQYRGILRIRASSSGPAVTVVNELRLETYLRGVVPAEMPSTWPAAALKAQAIAARSYAARRLRPGVSYYDVVDTSSSQVYRGALGERATTNAIIAASAGVVLKSGSTIANTLFHSTGGGATESNQNVFTSSSGAKVAGAVSYLRGSSDRAPDGSAYDKARPVRDLGDEDLHARTAVRLVRRRPAHRRRDAERDRPARPRRLGPADQRHPDRLVRDEDGLGRGLPVGVQRRPSGRRPDAPEHALRDRADPLSHAIVAA